MRRKFIRLLAAVAIVFPFAGCDDPGGTTPEHEAAFQAQETTGAPKPVDLSFYMALELSDEWIRKYIIDPVQRKYPHISIHTVRSGKGTTLNELVAAGETPDIIYQSTPRLGGLKDLGLFFDMRELIKTYHFDLGKLNQTVLDSLKMWGEQGEIYALPLWMNYSVLYYNKDLFDKFGVPYPKDGMTWDEAIELSRRLTRTEGGIAYRGLDHDLNNAYSQLSQSFFDPQTTQAIVETEASRTIFQMFQKLYSIPGNENRPRAKDAFLNDQTLAMWPMYADVPTWINDMMAKGGGLNWDMAQMPSFKDRPGIASQVDSHNLLITSKSRNKEAAFQVIAYLLSEEPQLELTKNGILSVLADPEMNKSFGTSLGIFQGKHTEAIFLSKPAPFSKMTTYDSIVKNELNNALKEVAAGNKDINTALRDANEAANQKIREKQAGQ